jgi:hypothetical protein
MEPGRLDLTAVGAFARLGRIDRCRLVAPWPSGGRGRLGIRDDEYAQPLGLARTDPVHQVMQVVMIVGGCHVDRLWAAWRGPATAVGPLFWKVYNMLN